MSAEKVPAIYRWLGGRKNGNGLLYAALLTAMAFRLDAAFETYALWLAVGLGVSGGLIAWEDIKKRLGG